jgi:hypothetical protein
MNTPKHISILTVTEAVSMVVEWLLWLVTFTMALALTSGFWAHANRSCTALSVVLALTLLLRCPLWSDRNRRATIPEPEGASANAGRAA